MSQICTQSCRLVVDSVLGVWRCRFHCKHLHVVVVVCGVFITNRLSHCHTLALEHAKRCHHAHNQANGQAEQREKKVGGAVRFGHRRGCNDGWFASQHALHIARAEQLVLQPAGRQADCELGKLVVVLKRGAVENALDVGANGHGALLLAVGRPRWHGEEKVLHCAGASVKRRVAARSLCTHQSRPRRCQSVRFCLEIDAS